jgi:hypothetical protein
MINKQRVAIMTLAIAPIAYWAGLAFATPIDKLQFIKISPQDARAVMKGEDGKLSVIKPGDVIGDTMTVKEIAPGRIVLEEKSGKGPETVIVRLDGGKTRIERLSKTPERRPLLVAPAKVDK